MGDPLIITAAIVGAETTRDQTPFLPITPSEIAEEARRCFAEGASIIHLHVRKKDGTPTQDKEVFKSAITAIKEQCPDIIVQVSTGGAVGMSFEERSQPLLLNPEMATLTTGTVNFGDEVFLNPLPMIKDLATMMKKRGITPEVEIFDSGMIETAKYLIKKGLLPEHPHFDFVMGVPGGIGGDLECLKFLISRIPKGSTFSVAGVGKYELPLAKEAIKLNGHVRVGLEDNIYIKKGVLAKGSWELVQEVAKMAKDEKRLPATPDETREILKIGRWGD